MITIKFPAFLTIRIANCLIQRCEKALQSVDKDILFDFSACSFSEPFAITLLVGAMLFSIKRGKVVTYLRSSNKKLEDYLNRIGFYAWGHGTGKEMKSTVKQVELRHLKGVEPLYTDNIITVLQHYLTLSQGVRGSLHLSLNELMTNTFDHSQTQMGCFVCAQAYKSRGTINICLTDFGRGILKSLSTSDEYRHLKNSIDAIELSIQEGVSSRKNRLAGLGLTHIHRFLKINEGQIHIISGDGWVHWDYTNGAIRQVRKKKLDTEFEGTIVNIIAKADGEGIYFLGSENPEEDIF
ncbi:MAG: hypothetical protein P4L45_06670 [Ignavibacteriaceae bacterium]|nr:hypothetical protein [Ignavibacteriaceae bacterium]